MTDDERYMKRALDLARRGSGRVSPNPLVGAVLVNQGEIVGAGYHVFDRRDHAEVVAIANAGERARGASLYTNLEPCSHQGRTPPCVEAVIRAGISRVVTAVEDPNPLVAGRGLAALRANGIEVSEGLYREEAIRLNEKFFHFVRTSRPFVLLKLAFTLDGRIATGSGESKWITGDRARRYVHRLRYEYDALLVGVNTLLRDDPRLDARGIRQKPLTRVVLDTELRTPAQACVFEAPGPVVVFHRAQPGAAAASPLARKAVLVALPGSRTESDWDCILSTLGGRGVTSLIIEGGGQVAASALKAGAIRKVSFFYAPTIVGAEGVAGIGNLGLRSLGESFQLERVTVRKLPPDVLIEGYVRRPARSRE